MGGVKIASLTNLSYPEPSHADGSGQTKTGAELAWRVRTRPVGFGGELSVALLFNTERDDWLSSSNNYVGVQLNSGILLERAEFLTSPWGLHTGKTGNQD